MLVWWGNWSSRVTLLENRFPFDAFFVAPSNNFKRILVRIIFFSVMSVEYG